MSDDLREAIERMTIHTWHDGEKYLRRVDVLKAVAAARCAESERTLAEMEARKDAAYLERNRVVAALAYVAVRLGWPVAVTRTSIEGWSEDWHSCIYIGLPTGQASWHFHDSHAHLFDGLPRAVVAWDGHTTEQKYERLAALRELEGSDA